MKCYSCCGLARMSIGGAMAVAMSVALAWWSIAPSRAQAPPGMPMAVVGARLIDGTGRAALDNATMLIANGRIQAIGPGVAIPPDAVRVDVSGKTVMPGLVNAHGHVDAARDSTVPVREQLLAQLRTYALYGVTTAYSLGSTAADTPEGLTLRDEQDKAPLDRARYTLVDGPLLYWAGRADVVVSLFSGGVLDCLAVGRVAVLYWPMTASYIANVRSGAVTDVYVRSRCGGAPATKYRAFCFEVTEPGFRLPAMEDAASRLAAFRRHYPGAEDCRAIRALIAC